MGILCTTLIESPELLVGALKLYQNTVKTGKKCTPYLQVYYVFTFYSNFRTYSN